MLRRALIVCVPAALFSVTVPARAGSLFEAVRSSRTDQVFDLTNLGTALATVTATDSTYATGAAGVIVAALVPTWGIDVTFDNLAGQTAPEPGSWTSNGLGLATASLFATLYRRRPHQR
jgi:hypothetical protein